MSNVTIRPYRPEDAEDLHAAVQESTREIYPWLPWCREEYTLEEAASWIEMQEGLRAARMEFQFAVCSDEGRFLGGCGLNDLHREHHFANLGYWVRSAATGKGVATRAVEQVRDWAFEQTELQRLELLVADGNEASRRVAERAGAVREGILRQRLSLHGSFRDAILFAFTRIGAMLLLIATVGIGCVAPVQETEDPDAILRHQMQERWTQPERRTWRIDYRPVGGLEGEACWHVDGTMFWVRIHPEVYSLEELDKEKTYQIDGVALAQNYGVIDFYIYGFPEVVEE